MSFFHVGDTSLGEARYYDSDGNEYWEVERIVSKKIDPVDGVLKYEVKWLGFGEEDNTWEPLENLQHVKKMVEDFDKAQIATKKTIPNKTQQSGKELSKKKDVKDDQSKAAQLKNTKDSVIEQKQSKKPTEDERLLATRVIESKKSLEGSEIGNKTDLNQNKRKPSNDEQTRKFQGNEALPKNNIKILEPKSVVQPPVVLLKDKQIIKDGSSATDKNVNLNAQQKRVQGVIDKGPIMNQNEQKKVGSGLTRPQPPNQSKYNPNSSNLISQDKIGQKESFKEISNGDSEFDIISRTTGISGDQRVDGDKKAPIKNTSTLGELFQPKKAAPKQPDAMIIEDDHDKETKANANENIIRANSNPGGEEPVTTTKSPLNSESQSVKRKSRFQDASEVVGKAKESLLDVPKAITRRESEKPIENIEIPENHLRRAASSNADIPSQNKNVPRFQETSEALAVPKVDRPIEKEIEYGNLEKRSSRFQEAVDKEKTFERRESEKSREKEENRERERDQSEDKRAKKKKKNEDSRKADFVQENNSKKRADRVKKKCFSESQPPKVEEERNQSSYYEAIKESYLKHDMNKNEFLEFLCPYGNFKDDKIEKISKVFWEGKASTNLDDYCFEIIWKTRSNGIHKAPTVVSWEDLLDGNPKEAAKFSFGRLTKVFSNFGTLEE